MAKSKEGPSEGFVFTVDSKGTFVRGFPIDDIKIGKIVKVLGQEKLVSHFRRKQGFKPKPFELAPSDVACLISGSTVDVVTEARRRKQFRLLAILSQYLDAKTTAEATAQAAAIGDCVRAVQGLISRAEHRKAVYDHANARLGVSQGRSGS